MTKSEVKNGETKHEKFRRLAPARMSRLITRARMVSQLASSSYESTPEEREKLVSTVFSLAHEIKHAFEKQSKTKRDEFSF